MPELRPEPQGTGETEGSRSLETLAEVPAGISWGRNRVSYNLIPAPCLVS